MALTAIARACLQAPSTVPTVAAPAAVDPHVLPHACQELLRGLAEAHVIAATGVTAPHLAACTPALTRAARRGAVDELIALGLVRRLGLTVHLTAAGRACARAL